MSGGRLMPDGFDDWYLALLGYGERGADGRWYRHDLSSVPIGWPLDTGAVSKIIGGAKQVVQTLFSAELLADAPSPHSMTWAARERRLVEHNRLRNRICRIPAWWRSKVWAARARVARTIYPRSPGWDDE